MANRNTKMFVCTFSNGLQSIMGADSKEDAIKAVEAMEEIAGSTLIDVEEIAAMPGPLGYLAPGQPQLNDGNEPDDDIDMGF
ncbi:MAG: hypothetical protein K5869_03855 [Saccharofermentans sp.]|nr:hypothetical protein [Saccharofermentans sp.]